MPKGLIIIADPKQSGTSAKMIAPTIKLLYNKRKLKCDIVNLYVDQFQSTMPEGIIEDTIKKSYMHQIKTADHIHIISSVSFGGIDSSIEGFIEKILNPDTNLKKSTFFYLNHSQKPKTRFNTAWFRVRFSPLMKILNIKEIIQLDYGWESTTSDKNKSLKKLRNKLIKKLFNE